MTYQALWSPLTLGELAIENRVFMSPKTRNRGNREGVPNVARILTDERAGVRTSPPASW